MLGAGAGLLGGLMTAQLATAKQMPQVSACGKSCQSVCLIFWTSIGFLLS
jgi:hypothetical protein